MKKVLCLMALAMVHAPELPAQCYGGGPTVATQAACAKENEILNQAAAKEKQDAADAARARGAGVSSAELKRMADEENAAKRAADQAKAAADAASLIEKQRREKEIQENLKLFPVNLANGTKAFDERRWGEAARQLDEAARRLDWDPKTETAVNHGHRKSQLYDLAGTAALNSGDHDTACGSFKQALFYIRSGYTLYLDRKSPAEVLDYEQKYGNACMVVDELKDVARWRPRDAQARADLAQAQLLTTNHVDWEPVLARLIANPASTSSTFYWLGRTFQTHNRNREALAAYTQGLKLSPGDSDLLTLEGETLGAVAKDGDWPEIRKALGVFQSVLITDPKSAGTHYSTGLIYSQLGQRETALRAWQAAVANTDADHNEFLFYSAQYHLGLEYDATNRHDEALAALRLAIQLKPSGKAQYQMVSVAKFVIDARATVASVATPAPAAPRITPTPAPTPVPTPVAAPVTVTMPAVAPAAINASKALLATPGILRYVNDTVRLAGDIQSTDFGFVVVMDPARFAVKRVVHIEYFAPDSDGSPAHTISGLDLELSDAYGESRVLLRCQCSEHPGVWTVRVKDKLTGEILATATFRATAAPTPVAAMAPAVAAPSPTLAPKTVTPQPPDLTPKHTGQTRVNAKDGLTYVWMEPGTFMMGCSVGDTACQDDEKPAHSVTLTKGFWIGQTQVTQEAYQRVTGETPSAVKGAKLPADSVNWEESRSYCAAVGMRLPSEAEWEFAARAGSRASRYGDIKLIAWYDANSGLKTHAVAQKQANAWGLYDMLGNVWQWTGRLVRRAILWKTRKSGSEGTIGRKGESAARCRLYLWANAVASIVPSQLPTEHSQQFRGHPMRRRLTQQITP